MKISVAQIKTEVGCIEENVARIMTAIASAERDGVELLCLPEMCIGGYMLGDHYTNDDYCRELMRWNEIIRKASKNICIAFGNIYLDEHSRGKDGRLRRYNAVYVYAFGRPAKRFNTKHWPGLLSNILPDGVHFKTHLPTYRFFEESRYFASLQDLAHEQNINIEQLYRPFVLPSCNIGFTLCEDLWCNDYPYYSNHLMKTTALNPSKCLEWHGAEAIVNLSASPWTFGKNAARDRRVKELGLNIPFFYCNCTGVQNNGKNIITFDGDSAVYGNDGKPRMLTESAYSEQTVHTVEDHKSISDLPVVKRRKPNAIAEKYKAIKQAALLFKDVPIVIGLSGGIDSCVNAALWASIVGSDNIIAINMPSRYNKKDGKDIAEITATNLGISYSVVEIETLMEANKDSLRAYFRARGSWEGIKISSDGPAIQLVEENLQAKIRAISLLSNIAQMEGGIFVNCGNKNEVFLGYATLDGDWRGAIGLTLDLEKDQVYAMGRFLNKYVFGKDVIPPKAFKVKPSAELKDDQVDPIKIGYHCALIRAIMNYQKRSIEDILGWWLEGSLEKRLRITSRKMEEFNVTDGETFVEDLLWLFQKMYDQAFKRHTAPPCVVLTKTAFGFDYREPIMVPFRQSKKTKELIRKIKKQKTYVKQPSVQAASLVA